MKKKVTVNKNNLDIKIDAFNAAMEKYNHYRLYHQSGVIISMMVILFQAITLVNLVHTFQPTPLLFLIGVLIIAYITTDFLNGLVHLYMDNNTNYTSIVGPFVATFHLHHLRPMYTTRHSVKVYFYESGTKFWLVIYLLILMGIQKKLTLPFTLNVGLVSFGILSSVAEVSHYWCHNATKKNRIVRWLQTHYLLLSKAHHIFHHRADNMNYAFLNGMTDSLLNRIARCWFKGYVQDADRHAAAYLKSKNKDQRI